MTEGGQFHDDIPPESEYLMLARDLKIVAQQVSLPCGSLELCPISGIN